MIEHIKAHTFHKRRGAIKNAFRYSVDFVLTDLSHETDLKILSRNTFNIWSIQDRHHGGKRGAGEGISWFRHILKERNCATEDMQLLLLTQPSFLWFHFNPVSFWIARRGDTIHAFVAEVNNTFGDRHCYFCAHPDFRAIKADDLLLAEKIMHVSPFQTVAGEYKFRFRFDPTRIDIVINYQNGDQGVIATLSGDRRPASNRSLLWAAFRRPFGGLRVLALIHWQAIILYFKRAPFLKKPLPPEQLMTESKTFRKTSK